MALSYGSKSEVLASQHGRRDRRRRLAEQRFGSANRVEHRVDAVDERNGGRLHVADEFKDTAGELSSHSINLIPTGCEALLAALSSDPLVLLFEAVGQLSQSVGEVLGVLSQSFLGVVDKLANERKCRCGAIECGRRIHRISCSLATA
jgi:hypothetical protein